MKANIMTSRTPVLPQNITSPASPSIIPLSITIPHFYVNASPLDRQDRQSESNRNLKIPQKPSKYMKNENSWHRPFPSQGNQIVPYDIFSFHVHPDTHVDDEAETNVIAESKNNRNENFILMVERKTPNPRSRLQENKGKEGNQVRKKEEPQTHDCNTKKVKKGKASKEKGDDDSTDSKEEPQTHDHIEKVKKGKASKGKASEEKGDDDSTDSKEESQTFDHDSKKVKEGKQVKKSDDSTDSEEEPQTHDHIEKVKKGKASKGKASEEKGDDDSTDSKEESQTFDHNSKKVKKGKQVKKSKNPQKSRLQENRKEKASEEKGDNDSTDSKSHDLDSKEIEKKRQVRKRI
ncbi:hypothetical protein Glove_650g2 [Diversispora epigaea]|uniref:Uncharacterized protein n=1 Tax=Diversispora epigaea TaxID=1348612 RepID=A0A397G421_9GLOM|nr:hypothetical protein Glove_650g2 [Diversispora epigaea]